MNIKVALLGSMKILLLAILLFGCQATNIDDQQTLQDWKVIAFQTDGCSSTQGLHWIAATFLAKNWNDCCVQHDFDYREGSKYGVSRSQADDELFQCVRDSGHPVVAGAMWAAVRAFGIFSYKINRGER